MLFPDVITASAPPIWWLPIPKATDTLQPKMIDMFFLDGARYGLQPCSSALPTISLWLWRKLKLKRVWRDKEGERKWKNLRKKRNVCKKLSD